MAQILRPTFPNARKSTNCAEKTTRYATVDPVGDAFVNKLLDLFVNELTTSVKAAQCNCPSAALRRTDCPVHIDGRG